MRKAAAMSVIALLLVASALLRPTPPAVPLPARSAVLLATAPVDPPRVRPGSDRGQTPVGPGSGRGRIGVRPGSEYEYESTQVVGTHELQELPTRPLETAFVAPVVVAHSFEAAPRGTLPRAVATAGRQTAAAFRTAGSAIRSIF